MKLQVVAVAALLITVGAGITKADSVVTGDLSFLCRSDATTPAPCPTGNPDATVPTGGFTYSHGQMSLDVFWDNVEWFFDLGNFSKDYFRSLTGKSDYATIWVAECIVGSGDLPGHCGDNGIYFYLFQARPCFTFNCSDVRDQIDFTGFRGSFSDLAPDGNSGILTANIFKNHAINSANIVSTPEPSVLTLLLSGLALLKGKKK